MNPIRIAHILPFANIGGTEKATLRLAEAAAHCGFENILFCPLGADELRRFFHQHCFVTACYEQVEPSYSRPAPYLKAAVGLARALRRHHVRIVHCADILGAHYGALAGRLASAYVLSHVRCRHTSMTKRDQTFLRPVQHYVFVSRDSWRSFALPVKAERGRVLYDGIEPPRGTTWTREEARRSYGIPETAPIVGMAARVHPGKDFETLIQAARIVKEKIPECRFLIAGDNQVDAGHREYYERLKVLLAETGTAGQFVFAGFEADMPRFYAATDVFTLATHAEGLPLVVLEAMSYARPVVATAVGGIPEVVRDEETGLLVGRGDEGALAKALLKVVENPQLAQQLGRAGCERVRTEFSETEFQHRVRELYCGIARAQGMVEECAPCIAT